MTCLSLLCLCLQPPMLMSSNGWVPFMPNKPRSTLTTLTTPQPTDNPTEAEPPTAEAASASARVSSPTIDHPVMNKLHTHLNTAEKQRQRKKVTVNGVGSDYNNNINIINCNESLLDCI